MVAHHLRRSSSLVRFLSHAGRRPLTSITKLRIASAPPPHTLASHPLISSSPANFCVIDRRNSGQVYLRKYLYSSSVSSAVYRPNLKPLPLSRGFIITPARSAAMSSKLIPSNPADVMVIRHVTPNIVTFSVPLRGSAQPRSVVVELLFWESGRLLARGAHRGSQGQGCRTGGNLAYIIALDYEHHIFISEWATQYPGVKIIGPEGLPEKRAGQHDPKIGKEEFAVVFKKENKHDIKVDNEFDADFDYEYVDGHANKEIVFLYKPEKVLIEADLLFNMPAPSKAERKEGFLGKLFEGLQNPHGDNKWMKRFNWHVAAKDRASFNESVKAIGKWDFVKLIPCHGDVVEENAKEMFSQVFEWHLRA
ncbi:unnamed protein product [Clonostachys rosea f. rosea IK726]|uniref:Uncharacterized protein n=1 Tax=Clonostachys rosea f. rosea IK726 TaxID=1349383 RepID=A0ACA9U522_BIOOC|nr:unnamed protein product [Clonostachys rosea f. rosea IK726]